MEHRDYLQAQIEEFGRIMGKVIARFMGMQDEVQTVEAAEAAHAQIKQELDLDIIEYLEFDEEAFMTKLKDKKLDPVQIEHLIDYHITLGEALIDSNKSLATKHLEKTLLFYQLMDQVSGIYSFDRPQKEGKIRRLLG